MLERCGSLNESERRAKMFVAAQRRSFFFNLPYDKQLYMLRKTEQMTSSSLQLAQEMSVRLRLPVKRISMWLKQRRKRNLKVKNDPDMKISTVKSILLSAEFARDNEIDEDKALFLAFIFSLPKKTVLSWYKKRQAQCRFRDKQRATKHGVVESYSKRKVDEFSKATLSAADSKDGLFGNQKKTPAQLLVLFEAFKKHSGKLYTRALLNELTTRTGLNGGSVRDWIKSTINALRTKTPPSVSAKLRENLSASQVRELQKEYRKHKYITRNEAEKIADSVSLSAGKVMHWFNNRRLSELFSSSPSTDVDNGNNDRSSSSEEAADQESAPLSPQPSSSGMSRVVIQKSTAKHRNRGIPALKVLRLLKDRRRFGNKKTFSKMAKELGLHDKQISSWQKNKKYREEMIRRAKKIYGDALDDSAVADSEQQPAAIDVPVKNEVPTKAPPVVASADNSVSALTTGTQHLCLFNAYKTSRRLNEDRLQELSVRTRMDKIRIRNWWGSMGKHMRRKNVEMLEDFLKESCNDEQREKLINTYSKARYYSRAYLLRLAEQIGLNLKTVQSWFMNARLYELKTGGKFKMSALKVVESVNLAWPDVQKLKLEFKTDPVMTDARAKSLSARVKIPVEKIKMWFEHRLQLVLQRSEKATVDDDDDDDDDDNNETNTDDNADYEVPIEEEDDDDAAEPEENDETFSSSLSIRLPVMSSNTLIHSTSPEETCSAAERTESNLAFQNEVLFGEFLKGSHLTPVRLQQLALTLNLSKQRICKWFSWLRSKVAGLPDDILLDSYRNKNLSIDQVNILESVYQVTHYPDEEKKEALAQRVGITRAVVKTWFANRRYYEILSSSASSPKTFRQPEISDFKPIITSISSGKATIDGVDVASKDTSSKSSIDNDPAGLDYAYELLNSYDFSAVDLDKIQVQLTEEPESVLVDCSSARARFREMLDENLEPKSPENLDSMFWYVNTAPGKLRKSYSILSDADVVVLEGMYETCPRPTLTEISDFAKRLMVSEQTVYWWFTKQRNIFKVEAVRANNKCSSYEIPNEDSFENIQMLIPHSNDSITETESLDSKPMVTPARQSDCILSRSADVNGLSISTRPVTPKKKRPISSHQRLILRKEFKKSNFISQSKARAIAADIGIPSKTVELWFRKQRQIMGITDASNSSESVIGTLNPIQVVTLEFEYRADPKLTKSRLHELAARLNVSRKAVILWFRERKQQAFDEVEAQQRSTVTTTEMKQSLSPPQNGGAK